MEGQEFCGSTIWGTIKVIPPPLDNLRYHTGGQPIPQIHPFPLANTAVHVRIERVFPKKECLLLRVNVQCGRSLLNMVMMSMMWRGLPHAVIYIYILASIVHPLCNSSPPSSSLSSDSRLDYWLTIIYVDECRNWCRVILPPFFFVFFLLFFS